MQVIQYPAPIRAHFGGGRSWPDVADNGGNFPHLLFSQAAVDILLHYDPKASVSEPAHVTFWPNKSLSRAGPPVYRTFLPAAALPCAELNPDADSPALFTVVDYARLLGCNEHVRTHAKTAKLKHFEFQPLFDALNQRNAIRIRHGRQNSA
jgi:hypothetical protein